MVQNTCFDGYAAALNATNGTLPNTPFHSLIRIICDLAETNATFTSDDISDDLRTALQISLPEIGAAFTILAGDTITCVGYTTSRRPVAHGRLIRVWSSRSAA